MSIFTSSYSPLNKNTLKESMGQFSRYKLQAMAAFILLVTLSTLTLITTGQGIGGVSMSVQEGAVYLPQLSTLAVAVLSFAALFCIAALMYVLVTLARPLAAKRTLLRLFSITLFVLIITAIKSLVLGLFARTLFAQDPNRFEIAKAGVDIASLILAVVLSSCIYLTLAASLREEKLELKYFGRSFIVMFFWVAVITALKFSLTFASEALLGSLAYISLGSIALSIALSVLSAVTTLWFLALALTLREEVVSTEDPKETPIDKDLALEGAT